MTGRAVEGLRRWKAGPSVRARVEMRWAARHPIATGVCQRIYHAHIRKTGGTSLNQSFIALGGGDPAEDYEALSRTPGHRRRFGDLVVAGWSPSVIEGGHYHYAFSHVPLSDLALPAGTFVVTCLRDPVDRVLSHHRMLVQYEARRRAGGDVHPGMELERPWLGSGLDDFIQRLPNEHLYAQLRMFSPSFDAEEAIRNLRLVDAVLVTEDLAAGIQGLGQRLRLDLMGRHVRSTEPDPAQAAFRSALREELADEYLLYEAALERSRAPAG